MNSAFDWDGWLPTTEAALRTDGMANMIVPATQPRPRRRGSLRRRLPLVIGLLLAASVATLSWAAYRDVEALGLESAHERMVGAASQLASLLSQSTTQRIDEARRFAAAPALRRAIDVDDVVALRNASAELHALLKTSPQLLSVELWRPGSRLAHAFAGPGDDGLGLPVDHPYTPPAAVGFTPLRAVGTTMYTELAVKVARFDRPAGRPSGTIGSDGFLVMRRRASTPKTAEALKQLMGGGLSLRFGSRDTGVWTDLSNRVEAPPPAPAPRATVSYTGQDGQAWLGTETSIAGAPWKIWVETPESTARATVSAFWGRMVRAGAIVVLVGTFFGWFLSRRITGPLHALTTAAEAMAAGEFSGRVRSGRRDEVGRLAEAFNTMASKVQAGYERLDSGIRERTTELEQTVAALEEAQEQLVRREKLAILGQLASGVGHELRNPLGVMTNAVYYLEMIQPDTTAEIQEYHGILRAQIGLAEKIVGDLLDFSRIKPPRREPVVLADLVSTQVARLTVMEGVIVDSRVTRDLPLVHIDPVQVGQIVFNLLVNAVQVLEDCGGTLTIDGSIDQDQLALHVRDTGPGVPLELRERIFEPLFTTKARGIGLGLAVSRSLAEANGGALAVTGETGAGAHFTLTMPIGKPVEAAA